MVTAALWWGRAVQLLQLTVALVHRHRDCMPNIQATVHDLWHRGHRVELCLRRDTTVLLTKHKREAGAGEIDIPHCNGPCSIGEANKREAPMFAELFQRLCQGEIFRSMHEAYLPSRRVGAFQLRITECSPDGFPRKAPKHTHPLDAKQSASAKDGAEVAGELRATEYHHAIRALSFEVRPGKDVVCTQHRTLGGIMAEAH